MKRRGIRAAAAICVLGVAGVMMATPAPVRTWVFLREFEKSGRAEKVSFWERVVYSLMEANEKTAACHAPRMAPSARI